MSGRVEVFMDGGVRQGTDVLKALAMGARAVFVGRPVLWGLAYKVGVSFFMPSTVQFLTNHNRVTVSGWWEGLSTIVLLV